MKKIILTLMMLLSLVILNGCLRREHTITFDSNGGTSVENVTVKHKKFLEKPTDPEKDKFEFVFWTLNDEEFLFDTKITSSITLVAKWQDLSSDEDVELLKLPYYSYLNSDNALILIEVKNMGSIKLQLFRDVAPNTVTNFLKYIEDEAFNNSSFHRIIKDFMIQGGIVENNYKPISGEFSANGFKNDLKHFRGVISMARTNDPNSATSQFFIVDRTSPHLDGSYAAFGGVVSGFDVLDKIASVRTNWSDAPLEEVVIERISVLN